MGKSRSVLRREINESGASSILGSLCVNLPDQLGPNCNPTFHDLLPVILGINNCREPFNKHLSEMIENQERD
ncbi:hypothetical protein M9H77_25520 [Catharanthus roseus]|uniref:Uncharacterized protein n=1 Tax=Catharanthus roseus TaxID=4058 RepID=A0ACC0A742_CATRO|nr:hypothetical protein M9H77_25520 [Catharanthus roseus]